MIASKYFPHYLGLNMLFHHNFHVRKARPGEPSGKTPGWFFLLIIGVFVLASPAVLLPEVWQYMNAYMGERLLTHSGYLFAGQLYKNNMSSTPFWGTPIYFYLLFLAIKVPLLILVAFLIGLAISVRRWRHVGHAFLLFMFLFWIVPYSLIGGKWLQVHALVDAVCLHAGGGWCCGIDSLGHVAVFQSEASGIRVYGGDRGRVRRFAGVDGVCQSATLRALHECAGGGQSRILFPARRVLR